MLSDVIIDLRNTSKPGEKIKTLKKYSKNSVFKNLVFMTYDPFVHFNIKITKKDLNNMKSGEGLIGEYNVEEMYGILDFCRGSFSPKQNREKLLPYLENLHPQEREFLISVVNKDWKAGVGPKLILKAFPNIISKFNVQLANTYKRDKKYKIKRWLWSYKLDGIRCVALRDQAGKWTLHTRKGNEILTVDHLKDQLEINYKRYGYDFFDGELYRHGLPFEEIQGKAMGFTRGSAPELQYHVFMVGSAKNFLEEINEEFWPVAGKSDPECKDIFYVHQGYIDAEQVEETLEKAFELGYEGIMLRDPDSVYSFKRSNDLLKLKQSKNDVGEEISDVEVVDVTVDDFSIIENGKMKSIKVITRLEVMQEDGVTCGVGSGLNRNIREKEPWELLGQKLEVKHQGLGKNGRMRFPRIHRFREDL